MVGTNLGSGTRTYNTNFCEYLEKKTFNEKIYIFKLRIIKQIQIQKEIILNI